MHVHLLLISLCMFLKLNIIEINKNLISVSKFPDINVFFEFYLNHLSSYVKHQEYSFLLLIIPLLFLRITLPSIISCFLSNYGIQDFFPIMALNAK